MSNDNFIDWKFWYKDWRIVSGIFALIAFFINLYFNNQTISSKEIDNTEKKLSEIKLLDNVVEKSSANLNNSILEKCSIETFNIIKGYEEIDSILIAFKNSKSIKVISVLESGKSINETPNHKSFFVHPYYLEVDSNNSIFTTLLNKRIDKFNKNKRKFELYKIDNQNLFVIGFVSIEIASKISNLNSGKVTFVFSPVPIDGVTDLAIIPIIRIVQSKSRDIDFEIDKLTILDVTVN